jgi:hypothetical protein
MHPLLPDLSTLTDSELEQKVRDLTKKYYTTARMGNKYMAQQIFILMDDHRGEQMRRQQEALRRQKINSPEDDIDGLINIG